MKKIIVTTTINPPTEAIAKFDALPGWELIVVGDLKTPAGYTLANGRYLSPEAQQAYDPELSEAIGWNCIQRRNFGLLVAHDNGADVVALVDDDNIPLPGWGEDLLLGREVETRFFETDLPAFDPVGVTNHPTLWHRGYPLPLLAKRSRRTETRRRIRADIQADFWNGDPDIDAICRMEHAPECEFDPALFPIAANAPSPFNSQNTFLSRHVLPDYFLFPHIGRMDDIWAAYHSQALGHTVIFGKASVYQQRNAHDLIQDMKKEYLGYEHNLAIVTALRNEAEALLSFLPERSKQAFSLYKRHFAHA